MSEEKNKYVTDFQITFFVGNTAITKMLSEVIKNRENRSYIKALGLPEDFIPPFFRKEEAGSLVYTLEIDAGSMYQATINQKACRSHIISGGDYLSIQATDHVIMKAIFVQTSTVGVGYKKYRLQNNTNIFIGRTPINEISCTLTDYISREKHAAIHVDAEGNASIEDIKRSVGVYVNGAAVHSHKLELYDEVFIMGLSIVFMGSYIAVSQMATQCSLLEIDGLEAKSPALEQKEKDYFVVTPRILKSLEREEIVVDAPPAPPTMDKTPPILLIGPSLTMAVVMMASISVSIFSAVKGGNMATLFASGTMAVGMLLGSLLWPSLLRSYQKKTLAAEEHHRQRKYTAYISEIEQKILEKKERTVRVLNETLYPSPEALCALLDNESRRLRLWERSIDDEDFLDVRLGLGSRPFRSVELKTPRVGFQLHEDKLRELPAALSEKYGTISGVPLTLSIASNHTIGVIGEANHIGAILNELILNVIALHAYDEVKLVLIADPKYQRRFEAFRNVPHIWSNDKKVRFFATNPDEAHYVLCVIDEILRSRETDDNKGKRPIPHYCVIVTDPMLIENEALGRYMEDTENTVGLTTVFAYGDITRIPRSCKTLIQSDSERTGYYIKNKNSNRFIPFGLDTVDDTKMRHFAEALSNLPIKRDQRSLGIADRVSFLQMYHAGNVSELCIEQHWDNNNSAKSLAAPIGVISGGEVFRLDIHESYHGCHGLVAGTTGSGKSEFLQAFVLSLAINYSPKEIAFVLVDFKGGDMARPFMEKPFLPALPHLAATISNLSGNTLYRALVSLDAEIKYRQRLFNESAAELGVDKLDINSYHKYYKGGQLHAPLPHLVIIIDEFAQLKTQRPDFLTQLINVAQVGRSLGIHLILATQKPSGIVDPQIMSNSRFKVCLKVAEKQDSIDMINRPDSAMIKNPGRLNLLVGYNEIYECVQSGYSGADYIPTNTYISDDEITVQMTDHTANPIHSARIEFCTNKSDRTQIEAVVAEIVKLGQKKRLRVKPLWLEALPHRVSLESLQRGNRGMCTATIGLADYVKTQEQKPLFVDFVKFGHIGLYGASGTGKTTFLQTLVYSMVCEYGYTPEELNLYAIDFGGRNLGCLEKLPHTGGVVFAGEDQKLNDLIALLQDIVEERKRLFAMRNCGTFYDYRTVSKAPLPAVVVLIDNYASFRDKYMDVADELTEVIGAGKTHGVFFVITGNTRNSIYYKVTELISKYYALRMNDPNHYLDILNVRPSIMPEEVSGRGITVIDRDVVEFQTALPFLTETEAERVSAVCERYDAIRTEWKGYMPLSISESQSRHSADESVGANVQAPAPYVQKNDLPESMADSVENLLVATSKTGAVSYGISTTQDNTICLCANNADSLAQGFRAILGRLSEYSERQIVFIDDDRRIYEPIVEEFPTCRYVSGSAALEDLLDGLKPELNARLEDEQACKKQIILVIAEFNAFFEMITDEQAAFLRKVFQYINSPKYGITFLSGFDVKGGKKNDRLFMSLVVNAHNFLICQDSYEEAAAKIETMPTIFNVKPASCYFCLGDKVAEIRW